MFSCSHSFQKNCIVFKPAAKSPACIINRKTPASISCSFLQRKGNKAHWNGPVDPQSHLLYNPTKSLRSSNAGLLVVSRIRSKSAERALSYCGPSVTVVQISGTNYLLIWGPLQLRLHSKLNSKHSCSHKPTNKCVRLCVWEHVLYFPV